MRPRTLTFTMAVLDRDGVSKAQKRTGAGALTITGDLATSSVATMDVARHVAVYCAGDVNTVTFTITGTDRYGHAISETITGVNTGTTNGTKNFKTVTAVATDASIGTDCEVGTTDQAETALRPVSYRGGGFTYQVRLSGSASLTWAFEYTNENVLAQGFLEDTAAYETDLTAQTAGNMNTPEGPFTACRLAITDWTSADDSVYYITTQSDV